jgi:hypothetical protein
MYNGLHVNYMVQKEMKKTLCDNTTSCHSYTYYNFGRSHPAVFTYTNMLRWTEHKNLYLYTYYTFSYMHFGKFQSKGTFLNPHN